MLRVLGTWRPAAMARADAIDVNFALAGDAPIVVELSQFQLLLHLARVTAAEGSGFVESGDGVIGAVLPDVNVIDAQLADLLDLAESLFAVLLHPLGRHVAGF